ncbi:MAG: DUF5654 family protein [Patescibacteria group bacterium]
MSKKFHLEIVTQMLTLCTSAFGLVAALAWNAAIQTFIKDFVEPYIPRGSSVALSQLVYALIVTVLVVTITIYLSQVKERLEK